MALKELPQVTAWRRDIHQHPELSNREVCTSALVAAELKKLSLEVHTGIAHTARVRLSIGKAIGSEHAIEAKPWMASEDFAQVVPSVYFFVGATPKGQDTSKALANHSPKFFLDEGAPTIGMESMLQASLDYLNGPMA
jgi:metal-dependent amidase/aminoacylase/carboxypeptidase family protein